MDGKAIAQRSTCQRNVARATAAGLGSGVGRPARCTLQQRRRPHPTVVRVPDVPPQLPDARRRRSDGPPQGVARRHLQSYLSCAPTAPPPQQPPSARLNLFRLRSSSKWKPKSVFRWKRRRQHHDQGLCCFMTISAGLSFQVTRCFYISRCLIAEPHLRRRAQRGERAPRSTRRRRSAAGLSCRETGS